MKKIIASLVAAVTVLLLMLTASCGTNNNKEDDYPENDHTGDDYTENDGIVDSSCPVCGYTDLGPSEWCHDSIHYCLERGMMSGDGSSFSPYAEATREEIVYALWMIDGRPAADEETTFADVDADSKYARAIAWAASTAILSGRADGTFAPKDSITREELAAVFHRHAKTKDTYIPAHGFALDCDDKSLCGFWARDALSWCVKNEIMQGVGDNRLDPQGTAQRSQVAAMLERYCESVLFKKVTGVYYSDFGAVGDGVNDDYSAIVLTHNYANSRGLPVFADEGATYYIGGSKQYATIRTDTTWTGATFIIDDSNLIPFRSAINTLFIVDGDEYVRDFHISSLKKGQKHLGFAPGETLLVTVENRHVKHYIRSGRNANEGTAMTDTFIVDAEGNILTDIVWDFDVITYCRAKRLAKPLVIDGGTFLFKTNRHPSQSYFSRNIKIDRSNTTIQNLTMKIIDEGETGSPYSGFITAVEAANVTLKNLNLDAYKNFSGTGTYALQLNYCANITLDGVIQGNDIFDENRWGIMCTNFCKDFLVKNSRINRYDAHMGVTNCTIENSTIGRNGVNLIGHGTFILKDSTVYDDFLLGFRTDYGSSWDGDVYIENVEWHAGGRAPSVIYTQNNGIHDYGYTCYQPRNVYIDGLHIIETDVPDNYLGPRLLCYYTLAKTPGTVSPYVLCEKVVAKNVTTESGVPVYLSFFEDDYPNVIWEISDSNIIEVFEPIPEQQEWFDGLED